MDTRLILAEHRCSDLGRPPRRVGGEQQHDGDYRHRAEAEDERVEKEALSRLGGAGLAHRRERRDRDGECQGAGGAGHPDRRRADHTQTEKLTRTKAERRERRIHLALDDALTRKRLAN